MSLFGSAPLASAANGAAAADTTNVDFMRALSQPLLIQTPLQIMLETLFFRSREQGAAVLGAQEQLSVLAAENAALRTKLTEREQAAQLEMQDLRKFCIASQERDSEKDSLAYKELQQQQHQMMSHLSAVSNQAHVSTQHISTRLDKEFKSRLDNLSVKLHGVDNMLGHQLAVHEMAGILGVAVAQVQPAAVVPSASTEGNAEAAVAGATSAAYAAEAVVPVATDNLVLPLAAESASPDSAPAELPPAEPAAASATALAGFQPAPGAGQFPGALIQRGLSLEQGGGQLSRGGSRTGSIGLLPQLKTQVEALEDKELELRLHVEMLRDSMSLQKKEMQTARADIGDAVAVTANIDGRFHMLESEMYGLWKRITDDQVARDKAAADKTTPIMPVIVGKAGDKVQGSAMADIYALQDQIRASFEGIYDLKQKLDQSDKHSAWVHSNCINTAATAAAEARALTNSFQGQLAPFQQDMQSLQTKVDKATSSIQQHDEGLQNCVAAVDDLAHKVQTRQRLSPEDWSRISQRAAAAAEAALQRSLLGEMQRDSNSPAGASRFRCLSCDTDLRTQRAMQQGGRPPSRPSLLPKLLALDPNSAALYTTPAQASDAGVQQAKSESLRHSPRASTSPDSAAYTNASLPELPMAHGPRRNTDSPPAPFWPTITNVSLVNGPGNAVMPPSIAARLSPVLQMSYDAADSSVAASGLPRQVEGVVSGDRRSPVLQPMGLDKRAWQVSATRARPMKPIFTV